MDLIFEIQIITLGDNIYNKFKAFLKLHSDWNLIDPNTSVFYRINRAFFDSRKHYVNEKFFKKLRKLTAKDIEKIVTLVVHVDCPNGAMNYAMLSFYKSRYHQWSNHAVEDWCICHKSKQIAWTKINAINPNLPFILLNVNGMN